MLANKVEQDLFEFNSQAKQLARDSRKVQMKRSKCAQVAKLQGLANRNISAINANMIPSDDQTITVLLNHPANDPFNKPTVIKVILVPEALIPSKIEIDYRYAIPDPENGLKYHTRMLNLHRNQFPIPTTENDFRFGIFDASIDRWLDSVATHKKADKLTFARIEYKWETTKPLFEGCVWNQFSKDFIKHRYNAKEIHVLRSSK